MNVASPGLSWVKNSRKGNRKLNLEALNIDGRLENSRKGNRKIAVRTVRGLKLSGVVNSRKGNRKSPLSTIYSSIIINRNSRKGNRKAPTWGIREL